MLSSQSIEWDRSLKKMFDEVDDFLENKFGDLFILHPNRLSRGQTSNKEMDGLFNIGASFSPGFGSKLGRGYVVDLHLSTLEKVDSKTKEEIVTQAIELIKELLPKYFPGRTLKIDKDGSSYKIYGDLSLGEL